MSQTGRPTGDWGGYRGKLDAVTERGSAFDGLGAYAGQRQIGDRVGHVRSLAKCR